MKLGQITDQIPQQIQAGVTGGAVAGAWASAAGLLQDWLGVVAAALSIIWLGIQIYSWYEKRSKR